MLSGSKEVSSSDLKTSNTITRTSHGRMTMILAARLRRLVGSSSELARSGVVSEASLGRV